MQRTKRAIESPMVNAQWTLYYLVHNIEKLAKHGYAQ
jgi:hypothetical protein